FGFAENTDDLFVGKTLLHGDVLMWLMKTLLTSGCTNQRGAGQVDALGLEAPLSGIASENFRNGETVLIEPNRLKSLGAVKLKLAQIPQ
ncbi:hypothetical protein ACO1ZF_19675, partial [Enterobacter kobei]|uniref:hypothetical protein n=1 Tax=Enterobacter kobei TaxID=208224 RepID=UPI003BF6ABD6